MTSSARPSGTSSLNTSRKFLATPLKVRSMASSLRRSSCWMSWLILDSVGCVVCSVCSVCVCVCVGGWGEDYRVVWRKESVSKEGGMAGPSEVMWGLAAVLACMLHPMHCNSQGGAPCKSACHPLRPLSPTTPAPGISSALPTLC
jgi:hypothetical protein